VAQPSGATAQEQERAKYEFIQAKRAVRAPQPGTRLQHARQRRGRPHVDSECLVNTH
tara:strand:- start:41 stop:211 length:171 start_codon:yes stop_codon:yes gene_type:complete